MTSTLLGVFSRQYKLGLGNRLSLAERHFSGARLGLSTRSFLQRPVLKRTTGLTGLGLALVYSFSPGVLYCDPSRPTSPVPKSPSTPVQVSDSGEPLPPPPKSSVGVYQLSFGTVAGICAGVFVKKGLKIVAFVCGGVFVLLQYLGSQSLIRIDWKRVNSLYENRFYEKDATVGRKAPTVSSAWNWFIHFLTADFPPRATFCAGFLLGLRVG